jgi:hypothetical protein
MATLIFERLMTAREGPRSLFSRLGLHLAGYDGGLASGPTEPDNETYL